MLGQGSLAMPYTQLLDRLKAARAPERTLDLAIAMLLGYRREVVEDKGDKTVNWYAPTGGTAERIPLFTSSVDDARELANALFPGHVAGCSWESGMASAKIDDGPYIEAPSPALALCIAVITMAQAAGIRPGLQAR